MSDKKLLVYFKPNLLKTGVDYYIDYLVDSLSASGTRIEIGYPNRFYGGSVLYKLAARLSYYGIPVKRKTIVKGEYGAVIYPNFYALQESAKSAVVVYDLTYDRFENMMPPKKLPLLEFVMPTNSTFLKKMVPIAISRSDIVITISESVKNELIVRYKLKSSKIVVAPMLPGKRYTTTPIPEPPKKFSLNKPYIFYQATLEPRKNHANLLDSYRRVCKRLGDGYSLVLAGGLGWKYENILRKISSMQSEGLDVRYLGYISEKEKIKLYQACCLYVQPSHYEGFGMPLLEALYCGAQVACSDIPVFHEVAGGLARYFNKDSPEEMSETILHCLEHHTPHNQISLTKHTTQMTKHDPISDILSRLDL